MKRDKRILRAILVALWLAGPTVLAASPSIVIAAPESSGQEEKIQAAFESLSADNVQMWEGKAHAGDAFAQNLMGLAYKYGSFVRQDHSLSAHWFRKAAELGFADAQFNLGRIYGPADGLYRRSRAAPEDYAEAARWLGKAAVRGYAPAQIKLGELYAAGGRGLGPDLVQAYFWTSVAAANGNQTARKLAGAYAARMSEAQLAAATERLRTGSDEAR